MLATGSTEAEDDPVADRNAFFCTWAKCFDHSDPFVAKWPVPGCEGPISACEMEVGVTDAAGRHSKECLIRSRSRPFAFANFKRSFYPLH
jgi:hypothetical protein